MLLGQMWAVLAASAKKAADKCSEKSMLTSAGKQQAAKWEHAEHGAFKSAGICYFILISCVLSLVFFEAVMALETVVMERNIACMQSSISENFETWIIFFWENF